MRLVVAIGGNALLKRGDTLGIGEQRRNMGEAADMLAALSREHEVVLVHGNGPQVGLLALEAEAYKGAPPYPLDVLGAESQGMIGYVIEEAMRRALAGVIALSLGGAPIGVFLMLRRMSLVGDAMAHAILPGAAVGVFAGYVYADRVNEAQLMAALGAITLAFGVYRLWVERGGRIVAASQSPGWVGSLFGGAMGFASQIAHAGGPPFQMWVAPRKLPHLTFVGTNALLFAIVNWIKVPAYVGLGAFPREVVVATLLLMPLAIVSTLLTVRWIRRINPERFYILIYVLMVLLGAKLFWDGMTA